jgi:mRNA export factor
VYNDFCFKCHRNEKTSDGDVYTVNAISFNKKFNTFCTVGSDGTFTIWNKDSKSRYKMSKPAPLGMTACAFNDEATLLAFASGEDWTKGNDFAKQRQNQIQIWVRKCARDDVFKPGNKK